MLKPLLLLLMVYFASCGSNGRNPTVAFVKPATSISAVVGEPVAIEYVDGDPDDVASTEIVADVDGNLGTEADQFLIAVRPERDGVTQTVVWDTQGVSPGLYAIFARTSDGSHAPVVARAAGNVTIAPNPPPIVTISFPTPVSLTDRSDLAVTGTASDPHGVDSISVAGVAATTDDGFVTWRARVPLQFGRNRIVVRAVDAFGASDQSKVVDVERQEQFAGAVLSGLALDPTNNRAHFADVLRADVYEVNLDTGERRLISGGDIGVGVALQRPESIAFDGRRNRLLVFESLNETSLRQAEPAGTLGRLC